MEQTTELGGEQRTEKKKKKKKNKGKAFTVPLCSFSPDRADTAQGARPHGSD